MSFSSLAPNFVWDDAFNTSYSQHFKAPPSATIKRNYMNVRQSTMSRSRKLSVTRVVKGHGGDGEEIEQEPALAHLYQTATLRS